MRIDLADDNIGVSVLCPGIVSTGIGSSERNRPDEFGGTESPAMTPRDGSATVAGQEMDVMEPAVIGDIVLCGIQNNEFYLLTHKEFRRPLENRAQEIANAFDTWEEYRKSHGT